MTDRKVALIELIQVAVLSGLIAGGLGGFGVYRFAKHSELDRVFHELELLRVSHMHQRDDRDRIEQRINATDAAISQIHERLYGDAEPLADRP